MYPSLSLDILNEYNSATSPFIVFNCDPVITYTYLLRDLIIKSVLAMYVGNVIESQAFADKVRYDDYPSLKFDHSLSMVRSWLTVIDLDYYLIPVIP